MALQISRSLRFRSSASAYLTRTPGSTTNQKTWTLSAWVKRSTLGADQKIFDANSTGANQTQITFTSTDTLQVFSNAASTTKINKISNQVFRDPSAFIHIVVAVDTTIASPASSRNRVYINGVEITSWGTSTDAALNDLTQANTVSLPAYIGSDGTASFLDGYVTDVYFVDGQQLTPSSFGQTDAVTGGWTPKAYAGTYGTNGFHLDFSDNSNTTAATLGADRSGNVNNWTPNNFSVAAGVTNDSLTDTPTNYGTDTGQGGEVRGSYATLNSIDNPSGFTLANGNLDFLNATAAGRSVPATIAVLSGKWFAEVTPPSNITYANGVGVAPVASFPYTSFIGNGANQCSIWKGSGGNGYYVNGGVATALSYTAGDLGVVAIDCDNGKAWCGVARSGAITWFDSAGGNTGNPVTGANPCMTFTPGTPMLFGVTSNSLASSSTVNFGQRPFAVGAPTGFKALCVANLADPAILKPSNYMDVNLRTGTGAAFSVTGKGFQPDLVWIKSRSHAYSHNIFDSVRGVAKVIFADIVSDENLVGAGDLTAFNSDGFSANQTANYEVGHLAETYVDWLWKKGATPGVDIVTYTGNGANRTIAHALGVAPLMMLVKSRATAGADTGWAAWHSALANTEYLKLETTAAKVTAAATYWNSTTPISSVFSLGTAADVNTNADTYIAYLFSAVPGFSAFGSYTGNGSADGPFVWCGFKPRWLMVKRIDSTSDWAIIDTARNTYNVAASDLAANLNTIEPLADMSPDILSNGFKQRSTGLNVSTASYIFAAFAEMPFKYASSPIPGGAAPDMNSMGMCVLP